MDEQKLLYIKIGIFVLVFIYFLFDVTFKLGYTTSLFLNITNKTIHEILFRIRVNNTEQTNITVPRPFRLFIKEFK